MNRFSHLVPPELDNTPPESWEVEANLPPAVRRAVRLNRIAAYERTPALEQYIPAERACLEFDI